MAEVPPPKKTLVETLELLEKQLQCAICLETYRDPKALACLHVYCRGCIQQLLLRQRKDQEVECPQCRSVGPVAGNDANSLPTMYFINGLIEIHNILMKAESDAIACQNCSSDSKATSFCHTCGFFICMSCNNAHKTMKAFAGHEAVPISEMREKALIRLPTKKPPTSTCQKHEGELLKFFCSNCEQLICRDCGLVDHTGHRLVSMKDVAAAFREEVLVSLVPLRDTHVTITTVMAVVEDSKKDITDQGTDIATTITQSFDQLKSILEERKQVLLRQVREVVGRKVGALDRQHEDLQLALATLDSLVGFVEKTAENASDEEFISMKQHMTNRVQEVMRKFQDMESNPKEVADMFVAVPPPTSLEELCKKSSVAKVDGPGLKSATTKQVAKFTVRTLDTHGQPPPAQQHISAELISLVDGSVLQTTVVSQTPSTYKLSYTPTTRGRHQLIVRVNNTEIGTFQVFVHHPPTQLGTPMRVIDGMKHPYYIAVSDTQLFVTEISAHRYTVFNMLCQRILTIGSKGKPPFGDGQPTGIATDGGGSVYVTSSDHKLWKFNRRGELIKCVGKKGRNAGEFDCPESVRHRNHQVYVCDCSNARVQVFDQNLEFIRTFGTSGDGPGQLKNPTDIDIDSHGNIYVVNNGKHQVLVFTEDGQYLRHFGQEGEGKGELNYPGGLCASGDCVYVADNSNHRISVFHTSGQFVHYFGKWGTGRGELKFPIGVATDQDGFVFVCDLVNNRTQVF